jgi:hypothetical protein
MSTVIVNGGGGNGGRGGGENVNKVGKKKDWMLTIGLLGGAAVVGYIATTFLSKKLGVGNVPTDLSSILSSSPASSQPTPDQIAAMPQGYPTVNAPVTNLAPAVPYLQPPVTNPLFLPPAPPSVLGIPTPTYTLPPLPLGAVIGRPPGSLYPTYPSFGGRINYGFAAKKQGEYDHGHMHYSEHDTGRNYEEIGDQYLTDTDDEELEVEEPYLHELYGVNEHTADFADFDQLALNEDQCLDEEMQDIHIRAHEIDTNDGEKGYSGHGDRHKHDRADDSQNRHKEGNMSRHHHMDVAGMGNDFKTRLVRDKKGKLVGLEHHPIY